MEQEGVNVVWGMDRGGHSVVADHALEKAACRGKQRNRRSDSEWRYVLEK